MYQLKYGSNLSLITKVLNQQDKKANRLYKMRKSSQEVQRDSEAIDQTKNALIALQMSQPYFNR
jgi:hypothetical protein